MRGLTTKIILTGAVLTLWSVAVKAETITCENASDRCDSNVIESVVQTKPTHDLVERDAHYDISIIPGQYEWVDGEISGFALEYEILPTIWESVSKRVEMTPKNSEIPAPAFASRSVMRASGRTTPITTQSQPTIVRKVLHQKVITHAQPLAKLVPLQIKEGRTRIQTQKPKIVEKRVPAIGVNGGDKS